MGPRAGLDRCRKSCLIGIRSPDRPARSEPLYRLSYPDPPENKVSRFLYLLKKTHEKAAVNCNFFAGDRRTIQAFDWQNCEPRQDRNQQGCGPETPQYMTYDRRIKHARFVTVCRNLSVLAKTSNGVPFRRYKTPRLRRGEMLLFAIFHPLQFQPKSSHNASDNLTGVHDQIFLIRISDLCTYCRCCPR